MSLLHPKAEETASRYLGDDHIKDALGSGIDGIVYSTSSGTAIKVHCEKIRYHKELATYQRLSEERIESVGRFAIPTLINWDDDLLVLEMTIVSPPFILDFANSALDVPPDFPPEVWQEWFSQREEEFGRDWPEAHGIYDTLRNRWGIYHLDLSPRNFNFGAR